ncbi:hypothetical protein [Lusitaniella coriacea]|uniref:hypothetical protein n=1 Tax=Lusitaniella coriacea TaxID=1983105 RepID=UPI003CEFE70B
MSWNEYGLDRAAQNLVLNHRSVIKESHKMREAVAYGLERFWGEHLRYKDKKKEEDKTKSAYWKATWDALVEILENAGITLPNDDVQLENTQQIQTMAKKLWGEIKLNDGTTLTLENRRVALAVLTQLCDCLVWWTQRYKGKKE